MGQVSYGTITIIDTTDKTVYVAYASNAQGANFSPDPAPNLTYVGINVSTAQSMPSADDPGWNWSEYIGTDGISVTSMTDIYYLKVNTNPTKRADDTPLPSAVDSIDTWSLQVPTYVTNGEYWTSTATTLSSGRIVYSTPVKDLGLTSSNSKAETALQNANIAKTATDLLGGHFIYKSTNTVKDNVITTPSGAGVIQNIADDPANWGYNTWIGSNGIQLRRGEVADATLDTNGLKLSKGGIEAGTFNSNDYIYIWSNDDNNHAIKIGNSSNNKNDWRIIAGNKFGVDKAGNLYANSADITGAITATSLTIGSGSTSYDGMAAINISGYSIEIELSNTGVADTTSQVYLIPHLYHNGIEDTTSVVYTRYIWYRNDESVGTVGSSTDGGIMAYRNSSYRVTYQFDDGEVGSGVPVQTVEVNPTRYITDINDSGIKVHPRSWDNDSNYLQIDGNGVYIKDLNDNSVSEFSVNMIKLGQNNANSVVLDNNGLQFYDSNNIPTAQFSTNMIQLGQNDTNSVVLDSNGLQFYDSNNIPIAQFNDTGITMGKSDGSQSYLFEDYHSLQMIDKEGETYFYINDLRNSNGIASESLKVDLLARDVFDIVDRNILSLRIYYYGEFGSSEPVELTNILNISDYTVDGHLYKIELPSAPQSSFSLRINYTADWTQYETKTFNCDGNTRVFYIDETTRNNIYNWQALVDDEGWHCVYYKNETLTSISFYDEVSGYCEFQYTTDTPLKNYTFGIRQSIEKNGNYSVVEGYNNIASGDYSHAEGYNTTANINTFNPSRPKIAAHAEGYRTTASGEASHAEGSQTTAREDCSHAEGTSTVASGYASHAEGNSADAYGEASHAEGGFTRADGDYSHAAGYWTAAYSEAQTVIGKRNITDHNNKYAFIIGNGTSSASNALTVNWNGNTTIAGTLTQSSDKRLKEHKSYLSTDAIDFIHNLKPAHFIKDNESHVGFYAQDVEEIDKWNCMVGEMNGYKTLGYTEIIAPLVAYCQHLEERIKELESK